VSALSREAIGNLKSPLAKRVELHEEIGSTQERARELAREGAPHGTLVISKVQTGGRGRLGRRWVSPAGGLWMSLVLRPDISTRMAARTTQAAAVGAAKALRGFGVEARIKWPNDLLVHGRKVCGILAELSVPVAAKRAGPGAERPVDFVVLGVGLNADVETEELGVSDREVATLRSELGHDVDLLEALNSLLSHIDAELRRIEDFDAILDDWRALNCTLGTRVRVRKFGEVLEGVALDLGPEGELLLKTSDGLLKLYEGEIEQLEQQRT